MGSVKTLYSFDAGASALEVTLCIEKPFYFFVTSN
jgi:hypothetical protein